MSTRRGYRPSYVGAYGTSGAASETAYLDRTAFWAREFENRRNPTQPAVNLALNKPATADSQWRSLGGSKWWQVDLQSTASVGRIVLRHAGAGGEQASYNTRDFDLQVSTDGTSWSTVAQVRGNTGNVSTHAFAARTARYVRVNVITPAQDGNQAARIYEAEVYTS